MNAAANANVFKELQKYATVTAQIATKKGELETFKPVVLQQCNQENYKAFSKPQTGTATAAFQYYSLTNQVLYCIGSQEAPV